MFTYSFSFFGLLVRISQQQTRCFQLAGVILYQVTHPDLVGEVPLASEIEQRDEMFIGFTAKVLTLLTCTCLNIYILPAVRTQYHPTVKEYFVHLLK